MLEHVPKHKGQTHVGRAEKVSACWVYLLCCYEFRQPDMRTWMNESEEVEGEGMTSRVKMQYR